MPGSEAKQVCFDAVDQPVVDLVRDDEEVVLLGQLGDGQQVVALHDGAGRVRRVADEDRLRARRDALFEVGGA